jgi:hypothetical protein
MVERAVIDKYIDPQREKLYAWEDEFIIARRRTFPTIRTARNWIKWACDKYSVPVPVVVEQPSNRGFSCYRNIDHRIMLRKAHWNPWCALHEAAHAICEYRWGILGHGPKFLSVLIWLLKESAIAPVAALTASAKAARLKFTEIRYSTPPRPARSARQVPRKSKRARSKK